MNVDMDAGACATCNFDKHLVTHQCGNAMAEVSCLCFQTGQHVNTFEGHTDEVFCLCLSGNNLYSGAQGGQILRWQLMA